MSTGQEIVSAYDTQRGFGASERTARISAAAQVARQRGGTLANRLAELSALLEKRRNTPTQEILT